MNELLTHPHLYWAFPIDVALENEVRQITLALHNNQVAAQQLDATRQQFVHALNGVIDAGFDFYYTTPASNDEHLNPLLKRTVESIIKTVRGAIHLVVQKVFKNMPLQELTLIAYYMDSMIIPGDEEHRPRLAYPLSDTARTGFIAVEKQIQGSDSTTGYASELGAVFSNIVKDGIHYYYHAPTDLITLNRIAKKAADLTMDGVAGGINKVIRHVLKDVSHKNVVWLFDHLHVMLLAAELDYPVASANFVATKAVHPQAEPQARD